MQYWLDLAKFLSSAILSPNQLSSRLSEARLLLEAALSAVQCGAACVPVLLCRLQLPWSARHVNWHAVSQRASVELIMNQPELMGVVHIEGWRKR